MSAKKIPITPFKRGYREIPQAEFAEAVSLVARHIAEQGELIEEATQPAADMVSKAHALRCFDLAAAIASATQQAAPTAPGLCLSGELAQFVARSRNNSRSVFCPPRSTCFTDWLNWSIRRPIWMSISRCCS